jgi:hypothetical protein
MVKGEYGLGTLGRPGTGGKKLLIMCYGGLMSNRCVLSKELFKNNSL